MEQLALGATGTNTPAGKVRTQQCVLLLALCTQRAVAFKEVAADFSLAGHVHVAVGAVAVAADPLQEVGAHRHLWGGERGEDPKVNALALYLLYRQKIPGLAGP